MLQGVKHKPWKDFPNIEKILFLTYGWIKYIPNVRPDRYLINLFSLLKSLLYLIERNIADVAATIQIPVPASTKGTALSLTNE